jgi:hypothetical protein
MRITSTTARKICRLAFSRQGGAFCPHHPHEPRRRSLDVAPVEKAMNGLASIAATLSRAARGSPVTAGPRSYTTVIQHAVLG